MYAELLKWVEQLKADAYSPLDEYSEGKCAMAQEIINKLTSITKSPLTPRPMDTAPKDGTMVRLLVDYSDESAHHPLEDAEQAWTIGFNNLANTDIDEWQFAGWCWSHDNFTEGRGKPIGWLPFHPELEEAPHGTPN